MKTATKHVFSEDEKQLFRQLFELQCDLERYNTEVNNPKITEVIRTIDSLFQSTTDQIDV